MPPTLKLHQTTSLQPGPLYRVLNEIIDSDDADPAVFVFKVDTKEFDHYATLDDLERYVDAYDVAVLREDGFYRQTSVQRDWDTVEQMEADVQVTQQRVKLLLDDLARVEEGAASDQTTTLVGDVDDSASLLVLELQSTSSGSSSGKGSKGDKGDKGDPGNGFPNFTLADIGKVLTVSPDGRGLLWQPRFHVYQTLADRPLPSAALEGDIVHVRGGGGLQGTWWGCGLNSGGTYEWTLVGITT